jgi:ketosteroid isomerase-like protein
MAGVTPEQTDRLIAEAISRQDLNATLDLYEPDAVFVDVDSGAELHGHEQIRAGLKALFQTLAGATDRRSSSAPAAWSAIFITSACRG